MKQYYDVFMLICLPLYCILFIYFLSCILTTAWMGSKISLSFGKMLLLKIFVVVAVVFVFQVLICKYATVWHGTQYSLNINDLHSRDVWLIIQDVLLSVNSILALYVLYYCSLFIYLALSRSLSFEVLFYSVSGL